MEFSNLRNKLPKHLFTHLVATRRPLFNMYQNVFLGYCYNCYVFGHKAIECRAPLRRNNFRNERKYYLSNLSVNQTKNSFYVLTQEVEFPKYNNFGDTTNIID